MDLRDLFRGLFGLNRRLGHQYQYPYNEKQDVPENESDNSEEFDGDLRPPRNPFNFSEAEGGSGFAFEEMLSTMEDMFREMEDSMRNIDSFVFGFGNPGKEKDPYGFGVISPFNQVNEPPTLPPPELNKRDGNVRDLVLKDSARETSDKRKKVDTILDDLYENSSLALSDVPEPPKELPTTRGYDSSHTPGFNIKSSYERVSSTHSFRNGMWEGKTVKENDSGKEITTYTRDANGELKETTEFIPKSAVVEDRNSAITPLWDNQIAIISPFKLFERFFKP